MHIDCFGSFLLDHVISEYVSSGIVDLNRRGWLFMDKFKE